MKNDALFSFIVPVFNEEETIEPLFEALFDLKSKIDGRIEIIVVDDGSFDNSLEVLKQFQSKYDGIKLLSFSRNFGHQVAMTAGMDVAEGDAVILLDADLQDPPLVAIEMIEKWREGYDMVYGKRRSREGETFLKKVTATIFYRCLKSLATIDIPEDTGDFRLLDRKILKAVNSMRETDRYMRGLFSWVGFKQTEVLYERKERVAGETHYPFRKMLRLAFAAIMGFSDVPLKVAVALGFVISIGAACYAILAVAQAFVTDTAVAGWSSMIIVTSFLNGLLLSMLGIVGLYIGRIHEENKRRPLYIVKESFGLTKVPTAERALYF